MVAHACKLGCRRKSYFIKLNECVKSELTEKVVNDSVSVDRTEKKLLRRRNIFFPKLSWDKGQENDDDQFKMNNDYIPKTFRNWRCVEVLIGQ